MEEHYKVIHMGENLYSYIMTEQEKIITEDFRNELISICNSLDIPRSKCVDGSLYMGRLKDNYDFQIKYIENIGYFALTGERGVFFLVYGFPTKNRDDAKFILLESEFENGGFNYELNQRKKLEIEWIKRYNVEYDSRKAALEYAIKMLNTVFKQLPHTVISKYTEFMNRWFKSPHWYFDENKMTFEELN